MFRPDVISNDWLNGETGPILYGQIDRRRYRKTGLLIFFRRSKDSADEFSSGIPRP